MKEDKEVLPVYAYRDNRTEQVIDEVHQKIPFESLYEHTGCQYQPFNTIYQLYDDLKKGRLESVTDFLMIPEYLMYKLCGNKAKEFTNATTMGMVNAKSLEFDQDIINLLGLPTHLFPTLTPPGEVIGSYKGIEVILCATHDTASAVEGIPMENDALYISSGTWSLLGVKTDKPLTDTNSRLANYSNEGGVGYNRYQKNIMGMWLVNMLKKELCPDTDFAEIVRLSEESNFNDLIDANANDFLAPKSMKEAFDLALKKELSTGDYFRCAYRSLAESYKNAINELEKNTGKTYHDLYIVGGGAKNTFLNNLCEEFTGKHVIALPIEATAIGNLNIQFDRLKGEEE
ncbi:MAG: rhamnulokinase [Erysipelotrichaceae bacterium]|nr:rhamnulokinase [Erysipelotrichaceae bacterium]